ncbi:MAG: hypothetical protein JWO31_2561 [Phycisphaerales bacterium]|nr:hypothetical protein [Phycisphaerales bacterium]
MVRKLTKDDYDGFLRERRFAVVHFDAAWDSGYRPTARRAMVEAEEEVGPDGIVSFGEVDVDAEMQLAKQARVENVPTFAYYRDGVRIATINGAGTIVERLRRLMRGERIDASSVPAAP